MVAVIVDMVVCCRDDSKDGGEVLRERSGKVLEVVGTKFEFEFFLVGRQAVLQSDPRIFDRPPPAHKERAVE